MNLQGIKNRVYWWLKKVVLYGLFSVTCLLAGGYFILQIPAVQKSLTSRIISRFSRVSGFNVAYEKFHLVWYDRLEIDSLVVTDPRGNHMIYAGQLRVNFTLADLWNKNNITLDDATLDSAQVNLVYIPDIDSATNLNLSIFIRAIGNQFTSSPSTRNPAIHIHKVSINRSSFSYNDPAGDSITAGFDYRHFRVSVPTGDVQDFDILGDTLQLRVNKLLAHDIKTRLSIKELRTFFRFSHHGMEFLDIHLKAGNSTVTDTVAFAFSSPGDMSLFNTKVSFKATLRGTVIDPKDLALFAPETEVLGQPVHIDGKVKGKVGRFSISEMRAAIGHTTLAGQLSIDGLPSLRETFVRLDLKEGQVVPDDIAFLFTPEVFSRLKPVGDLHLNGKFFGFFNDFVADGVIDTRLGKIRSDINLKINEQKPEYSTYHGKLELDEFDLGAYLRDTATYQKISLNGQIEGQGLTRATANFTLDGKISSLGLLHYTYTDITTRAQFARQLFNGFLTVRDPHLKLTASGSIDLRHRRILVTANLDTAWLQTLHLSRDRIFISSAIAIDSYGLQVDSLFGNARLKNTVFMLNDRQIRLDSVSVVSGMENNLRKLNLHCPLIDVSLEGNYQYSSLFTELGNVFQEFYLNLKNDKKAIASYYAMKMKDRDSYGARFDITLHDVNPVAKMFDIPVKLSANTRLTGEFSNARSSIVHARLQIDTLRVNDKIFDGNEIEFSAIKSRDSTDVLATLTLQSDRQQLSSGFSTRDLFAQCVWIGDQVEVGVKVDQEVYNNTLQLNARVNFLADSTRIHIQPSRIVALEKVWTFNPGNYTLVRGDEWQFHDVKVSHEDQAIFLDGRISRDPETSLKLTLTKLDLDFINSMSTEKFGGTLNGVVNVRNVYTNPYIQNNVTVDALTINKFLVGNVTGTNRWNQENNRFDINFYIDRLGKRIVDIAGEYNPNEKENPLNVHADLQETNLKIIEPLLRDIFSQIDGTISGKYSVSGTFSEPKIKGEGKIANGQIMVDYLRTLYTFSGTLGMTSNEITFKDFTLIDAFKNRARLDGSIAHHHFSDMNVNLGATFTNFQVLNTTIKDNDLFYGQGYVSGKLTILGPAANLKISAAVKSEKNTRIFIPINGTGSVERKDFVSFTHFTDTAVVRAVKKKVKEKVELSGIALDLNLDITPAALVEIIFDIKSGDIIRGRGNGDIKVQLDTKGEFNMFGSVEFTEGAYNFTLYDIINKEFSIKQGSRISWFGDPYQGTMNISASYKQLATLTPLLSDPSLASLPVPALRRRYPIEVILKLDGPMLAPQINFDIDAKDLPNSVTVDGHPTESLTLDFSAFKARLDEQELKKQVFSLIMLRRFAPYGESINTSGGIANSVSELFSNQLSYWLSQVNSNLEIDLDLGAFDQEAFNTFQLRLSYSFLNGRLRVTRDGAFNNQYNRSDASSIAGDWTVDYLLTQDGKFKVKMYSRSNVNAVSSSLGNQTAVTTGVSLLHTQNFNQIKDLLRSARERKRKELEKIRNDDAIKKEEDDDK